MAGVPWLWLAGAGVLLLAIVLVVVTVRFGTPQEGVYVPPRWENGQVVPGHIEPTSRPMTTAIPAAALDDEPATQRSSPRSPRAGPIARFVGGAVRDALLGRRRSATSTSPPRRRPRRSSSCSRRRGIKVVPTGIAHGTVTAVVPPRHFEITTLRRDVETFGRHARVAFDADWAADAARRDFTINAIFLDPDGTLARPGRRLGRSRGPARALCRRAGARAIAEDVLRVLRYYRFEARFGNGAGDAAARAACRAAAQLLPKLSAERVAQELPGCWRRPIRSRRCEMMPRTACSRSLLPEARRLDRLRNLIAIEPQTRPAAPARGAGRGRCRRAPSRSPSGCGCRTPSATGCAASPRPGRSIPTGDERAQRRALYRLGAERYRDLVLLAPPKAGSRRRASPSCSISRGWKAPVFPLGGDDVTALGIPPGPRVGRLLAAVRRWWEEGDFAADRAACLARLREVMAGSRSSGKG